MKRLKAFAQIICHTILRKQVKDLLAGHSFGSSVFFDAECHEEGDDEGYVGGHAVKVVAYYARSGEYDDENEKGQKRQTSVFHCDSLYIELIGKFSTFSFLRISLYNSV